MPPLCINQIMILIFTSKDVVLSPACFQGRELISFRDEAKKAQLCLIEQRLSPT